MVIMPKMHISLYKFKGSLNFAHALHALELSVVGETTTGGSNSELTDESSRMNSV